MALEITFFGHSGFLLEAQGKRLAVDPFLSENELASHAPKDVKCDAIALTHGHFDHFGDTIEIARNNDAQVIGSLELCEYLGDHGISNVNPGFPGGKLETDFGWIAFIHAIHASTLNGRPMGAATGLMIHMGGVTFYHLGDTALFSDMALMGEIYKPDVAAVPVGDRFTMGPELATRAAEMINPKAAIPVHYKTFDMLRSDCEGFSPKGVEVREMQPGQTWKFDG